MMIKGLDFMIFMRTFPILGGGVLLFLWIIGFVVSVILALAIYLAIENVITRKKRYYQVDYDLILSWIFWPLFAFILIFWSYGVFVRLPDSIDGYNIVVSSETTHIEIYSLDVTSSVYGRFSLGSGSVSGRPAYEYFYYSNGGYFRGFIYSDGVKLILDDDEIPRIETVVTVYKWTWSIFENTRTVTTETIYIPEDSIIQRYLNQE